MEYLPLPDILKYLPYVSSDPPPWIFTRPAVGKELILLHEVESALSPGPTVMAVRQLTLSPNQVVPVHVHDEKEKVYIAQGPGFLQVLVFIRGEPYTYEVRENGQRLIVPPGCPHALIYRGVRACSYLVITTNRNANDIRWQDGVDELVLNRQNAP